MSKHMFLALGLFLFVAIGSWVARHFGFYNAYWYTDVILHITSGLAFGFIWLGLSRRGEKRWWMLLLGAAGFAALGSLGWELWEFAGWHLMPSHTQFYVPGLGDSLGDMGCGAVGGALASLWRKY